MKTRIGSALTALLCAVFFAPVASADTYQPESWADCTGGQAGGGWNAGGYDDSGRLYIACGSAPIRVFGPAGNRLADIAHGAGTVSDVAASAGGAYLYLARGSAPPRRMTRQPNGTYVLDAAATWSLATYPSPYGGSPGGQSNPMGHSIETDAAGNVYLADGSWVDHGPDGSWEQNHNTIVKYSAGGAYLTRFGQKLAGSWALGNFHEAVHGIAVTPDGSSVYAADGLNNRVQRFDRQGDGSYVSTWTLGSSEATNPGRTAYCDQRMASPYGVALDEAGSIYVLNTTCDQLLKFDPSGALLAQVSWASPVRPHGFAVSRNGRRVYVQESQALIRRTDLGPEADPVDPAPDPGPAPGPGPSPSPGPGAEPCPRACGGEPPRPLPRLTLRVRPAALRLEPGARRKVRLTIAAEGEAVTGVRVCVTIPRQLAGAGCVAIGRVAPGSPLAIKRSLGPKPAAPAGASYVARLQVSGQGVSGAEARVRVTVKQ